MMPKRTLRQITIGKRAIHAKAIGYMKPTIDPQTRLYVPFNEGVGALAKDYSQYGNHAVLTDVEWGIGLNGNAGVFNGVSSYGSCDSDPILSGTGTWCFAALLNPTNITLAVIFQNSLKIGDRTGMAIIDNTLRVGFYDGAYTGKSGPISINSWSYAVGSCVGGAVNLYINSILQVGTDNPTMGREYNRLLLGVRVDIVTFTHFFDGTIVSVIIKALAESAAQIAADCYEVCN